MQEAAELIRLLYRIESLAEAMQHEGLDLIRTLDAIKAHEDKCNQAGEIMRGIQPFAGLPEAVFHLIVQQVWVHDTRLTDFIEGNTGSATALAEDWHLDAMKRARDRKRVARKVLTGHSNEVSEI